MPRVVHLSSAHPAKDIRIFHKMAVSASLAGFDVCVIARAEADETCGRVRIRAIPSVSSKSRRMTVVQRRLLAMAIEEDADLYHFHDPELIPSGLILAARGKRVIYDVHEDMPRNILSKPWIPGLLRPLVATVTGLVERSAAAGLGAVVAATPSIAAHFPRKKTVVLRNYPILSEFAKSPPSYSSRAPVALYVGAISEVRGLSVMLEAAQLMCGLPGFELRLAGPLYPPSLLSQIEAAGPSVRYLGSLGRQEVITEMTRASVGLMLGQGVQSMRESYPIKVFEYMAAGLPMVLSDFELWRTFAPPGACAEFVDPAAAGAVARSVTGLLGDPARASQMGAAGRARVMAMFDWDNEAESLIRLYGTLLA